VTLILRIEPKSSAEINGIAESDLGDGRNSVFSFQYLEISSPPIRVIRVIRGSESSPFLN
jgi:hypothetical protein